MNTGKNREIRKIMQKNQLRVNRIIRTRYGPYSLEGLLPGQIMEADIHPAIKRKVYLMMRKDLEKKQGESYLEL
jgi:23S rRNA pseudouridine2605 synthase